MIKQYITQFCKGELDGYHAQKLLMCDLDYFFETCTGKKEMTNGEFVEYRTALLTIQANPRIRNTLKILEGEMNVEEEFKEFEYRRSTEIYSGY